MTENVSPLVTSAKSRTKEFLAKIERAKTAVELDVERNEGVYPLNGGRLSLEEVCRRAGFRAVALHGPKHKETTRRDLQAWLDRLLQKMAVGKAEVRKAVTERAEEWEEKFNAQANWIHQYHLLETDRLAELMRASERIKELEREVLDLTVRLNQGKVVPFDKR